MQSLRGDRLDAAALRRAAQRRRRLAGRSASCRRSASRGGCRRAGRRSPTRRSAPSRWSVLQRRPKASRARAASVCPGERGLRLGRLRANRHDEDSRRVACDDEAFHHRGLRRRANKDVPRTGQCTSSWPRPSCSRCRCISRTADTGTTVGSIRFAGLKAVISARYRPLFAPRFERADRVERVGADTATAVRPCRAP